MGKVETERLPVAKGVAKVETPEEGVEANKDAEPPREGIEADRAPKSDDCGEAPDDPNKEIGAEVAGVENREADDVAAAGADKKEKLLPEEADGAAGAAASVAVDAPGIAELEKSPATWVAGCGSAGKCRVGCTLLAAASCLAVSRRSASRNGSFPSPRRR